MDILARLRAVREHADNAGIPVRRKDETLYRLLAECLEICEDVDRNGLHDELRAAVRVEIDVRGVGNSGRGRRYAFKNADVYILVARSVLEGIDNRNSIYRYAGALRAAAERQVTSDKLCEWLKENGGVVSLYKSSKRADIGRETRTVVLDTAVSYRIGVPLTITIVPTAAGQFHLQSGACRGGV